MHLKKEEKTLRVTVFQTLVYQESVRHGTKTQMTEKIVATRILCSVATLRTSNGPLLCAHTSCSITVSTLSPHLNASTQHCSIPSTRKRSVLGLGVQMIKDIFLKTRSRRHMYRETKREN
jgi:hypothetical protein